MTTALHLHRLAKHFEAGLHACRAAVVALRDVDLDLRFGEIMVVTGPRGSGKTTLLQCAAGVIEPTHGSIFRAAPVVFGSSLHDFTLVNDPPRPPALFVWDDPLSGAAPPTRAEFERWLRGAHRDGDAVLISMPTPEHPIADDMRIIRLHAGRVIEDRDRRDEPIRRARIAEGTTAPHRY